MEWSGGILNYGVRGQWKEEEWQGQENNTAGFHCCNFKFCVQNILISLNRFLCYKYNQNSSFRVSNPTNLKELKVEEQGLLESNSLNLWRGGSYKWNTSLYIL